MRVLLFVVVLIVLGSLLLIGLHFSTEPESAGGALPPILAPPALLTMTASLVAQTQVRVDCGPPHDWGVWKDGFVGMTFINDPDTHIHLRYCKATVRLERAAVDTFAHELLHVEHQDWPEKRVYATEHQYGKFVLRMIAREERVGCLVS